MDQFKHLDDSTIYDKLHSVSRPSASRVRNKKAPTVYRSTGPSTFLSGCVIRSEAVILRCADKAECAVVLYTGHGIAPPLPEHDIRILRLIAGGELKGRMNRDARVRICTRCRAL